MGKFEKGHPKPPTSGRKKGTKNKKQLLGVEEFFAAKGEHPLELLMRYVDQISDPADKAKIMVQVLKYWAALPAPAKPKADEPEREDKVSATDLSPHERLELIRGSGGINRS